MADLPQLTARQIADLEAVYPPKCYDPTRETHDQHQAYRGKVDLIEALKAHATDDPLAGLGGSNAISSEVDQS